jgi:hypothetical protein
VAVWRMCGRCGPRRGLWLSRWCGSPLVGRGRSSISARLTADAEVELLKAVAAQRIAAGQDQLPLDVAAAQESLALEILSSRMGRLLDAIAAVHGQLGFDKATGRDAVFEQLVTARIIEPTSKQDAARVLAEAGVRALSYRTVKRRLPGYAAPEWRGPAVWGVRGRRRSRPVGADLVRRDDAVVRDRHR